jgi:tetratricopeptide (TPR) repeat protein
MTSGEQPHKTGENPVLIPPEGKTEVADTGKRKQVMVWVAMIAVAILGLLVIFVLPKIVSVPATDLTRSGPATPQQPPGQDPSIVRRSAEKALQEFLRTRARLELANAMVWGDPEWSLALDDAKKGDRLFGQKQFAMARDTYGGALETLLSLDSEKEARFENAMGSAQQALEANDSTSAEQFYKLALAIEPLDITADDGLQRAMARPQVLQLMKTGERAYSLNTLQAASQAYQQALALDKTYEPATAALQQVDEQIRDLAFQEAMSRALTALENKQVVPAEKALREAAAIKPGEEVLGDAQQQLKQLRRELWIAEQRGLAAEMERSEKWTEAAGVYRKILTAVPQAAFAREGIALADDRAQLHRQFDQYIDDPGRLYSEEPLGNAEVLLESAGEPPPEEKVLTAKVHRLQALVTEAQTPLTVTLQSDGLTSVLIYHVGKLGQFTSQQLQLRPGTYTIVGSRPGYRDVRQTFTLKPGSKQPPLVIRCEETV